MRTDGWTDGRTDGQTDRQTDRHNCSQLSHFADLLKVPTHKSELFVNLAVNFTGRKTTEAADIGEVSCI